ncbi:MAG: hypothetical protein DRP54_08170 [Spirochaetes bacterium]|nr:MAG: hypothetical protein DRP54_08170 [Spirochaetota bacterium]
MFSLFFGWQRKLRKLRKKWDRLREKTLKKEKPVRHILLEKLDRTEEKLRILEERTLTRWDRARLSKEIEIELEEIKAMLEAKPEEIVKEKSFIK